MKKVNERWVDENNNSWDCDFCTEEQAEIWSNSLSGCRGCYDCYDCRGCQGCYDCHDCHNCYGCYGCYGCRDCRGCFGCKNYDKNPSVCPEEGAFIAWKKCRGNLIVKLRITENAKRSSANSRKCRCSEAEILEIQDENGTISNFKSAVSTYNWEFIYEVGKTVRVDNFDENPTEECSTGIHFFITRQEAVDY